MEIVTRTKTEPKGINRTTYVLVHGGWHEAGVGSAYVRPSKMAATKSSRLA